MLCLKVCELGYVVAFVELTRGDSCKYHNMSNMPQFNTLDPASYHQLCALIYRPIVQIQCNNILIPTSIYGTGILDQCIVDQYYCQRSYMVKIVLKES